MLRDLLVLLFNLVIDLVSRVLAPFKKDPPMIDLDDKLHDEIQSEPIADVKPGTVEPKTPIQHPELYQESQDDAGKGPKPGSVDDSRPTNDSFDKPE